MPEYADVVVNFAAESHVDHWWSLRLFRGQWVLYRRKST